MDNLNSDFRSSFLGKKSKTPGPGAYQIPSMAVEGPFHKFRTTVGKSKKVNKTKHPGPGDHNLPPDKITGGFIPGSPRFSKNSENLKFNVPGPGTYNLPDSLLGSPWVFHSGKPPSQEVSEVGPGSYNTSSTLFNRKITLTGKSNLTKNKSQLLVPGPGAYEPVLQRPQSSILIGRSKRPEIKYNEVPGPGTYEVKLRPLTTSSTFGIGGRTRVENKVICDAFYEIPSSIGQGAKITISNNRKSATSASRKRQNSAKSLEPGPGKYEHEHKKSIPSFLFGTSCGHGFGEKERSPGPVYNPEGGRTGPSYSFTNGRSQNFFEENSNPGPGAYESGSSLIIKKFSFKGIRMKTDTGKNNVPGPGKYDLGDMKNRTGGFIGKDNRRLEWTLKEKEKMRGDQEEIICKCMNPNLKYRKKK